ncbi:hypothetical protein GGP77_000636 [Salinibacter ruber]|uniref:ArdC-like ssDNA-binding domain-containing protein n=1 Tax=Salinibacter ruber TaxID=146919 RepID=UPI00216774E2|nr:ArdC-like ssDNA-binding domain-containing protein [Salinibacter ruber]MCS3666431.1 hypothetical protein [Salinibacter ruber]
MNDQIVNVGRHPDAWKEWLEFRARFHDYSFRNRMLVHAQRPHAQHVAGYKAWHKQGRQVRGGESGNFIWVPIFDTADTEEEAEDEGVEVGEKYLDWFRVGHVYAWRQTVPIVERSPEEIGPEEEGRSIETVGTPRAQTAVEAGTDTLPEPIPLLSGDEHEDIL